MTQLIQKTLLSFFVSAFLGLAFTIDSQAQELTTIWERTDRTGAEEAAPDWFEAGFVRGMDIAVIDGNERLYIADRTNTAIQVIDAETGADVELDTDFDLSGVEGGLYTVNDLETSDDGKIFVGALSTNASTEAGAFQLYMWDGEGGAFASSFTIQTTDEERLGDRFSVIGSVDDNSVEIWVPVQSSNPGVIYIVTTDDEGDSWSLSDTLTLSGTENVMPANASVAVFEAGGESDFYIAGNGSAPMRFNSDGEYIEDSLFPSENFTSARNGISVFTIDGDEYLAAYTYNDDPDIGTNTNNTGRVYVYDINDATSVSRVADSPMMGDDADTFSSVYGKAIVRVNDDDTYNIYGLEGVNGIAAYTNAVSAVDIKFIVNTSTIPDTLRESDFIQLRGAINGNGGEYLGQMIDWNAESDLVAENKGGDYWEVNFQMTPEDTLIFKVWSGFDSSTGTENGDGGWEVISEDRRFGAPSADTTVLIYSDSETPPFESVEDSVTLFFRVNVGAFVQDGSFDPATDSVGIRGNPDVFRNPGDWSSSAIYLELEDKGEETSDNVFYSGVVRVDNAAADTLGEVPYKFVGETQDGELWDFTDTYDDPDGNRFVDIPTADSTIHWVFLEDTPPTASEIVTADLTFEVNVGILEVLGYFDSGVGDQVVVRGEAPLDWGTNDNNTASFDDEDVVWRLTREFTKAVDSDFNYKYYIEYDESRSNEDSENYEEAIAENVDFGYEEPVTTGGSDRTFEFGASTTQSTGVEFFNDVNIGGLIESDNTPTGSVEVTFSIDMTPALENDPAFRPGVDSLYLQMESKYTALTNGFRSGGGFFEDVSQNGTADDIEFLRFTDENEDNIYTLTLDLQLPTINDFGYVVRYGQPFTEFNEMFVNGAGFGPGRRYFQFIEPTSVADHGTDPFLGDVYVSQWPSTFEMETVTWAADDLEYDTQPDYAALATSSEEETSVNGFALSQNYPNPFNPTTNINFTIPSASDVKLTVYNVLGQQVAELVNKRMTAGSHTVRFDAADLASGMYLYRIEAGTFVQNKRMMLIK